MDVTRNRVLATILLRVHGQVKNKSSCLMCHHSRPCDNVENAVTYLESTTFDEAQLVFNAKLQEARNPLGEVNHAAYDLAEPGPKLLPAQVRLVAARTVLYADKGPVKWLHTAFQRQQDLRIKLVQ